MSLPGPNVRVSLDSRYLAWPHLLRDPNPTATTTNCTPEWAYCQWRFQGQGNWTDQQLKLARRQCGQQPRSVAVGSDEPSSTLASVGRAAGTDSESYWLCTYAAFLHSFFFLECHTRCYVSYLVLSLLDSEGCLIVICYLSSHTNALVT